MEANGKTFIVIEGIDGSGKTTVAKALAERIGRSGSSVALEHEPTDSAIGKLVRQSLTAIPSLSDETIALLFAADRAEHKRRLQRAFEVHDVIVCDRYYHSSLAYQEVDIHWNASINKFAMRPDIVFYLDVPMEIAKLRLQHRRLFDGVIDIHGPGFDVIERARGVYEEMVKGGVMRRIDAVRQVPDVVDEIYRIFSDHLLSFKRGGA